MVENIVKMLGVNVFLLKRKKRGNKIPFFYYSKFEIRRRL